jgi:hypothetical protein
MRQWAVIVRRTVINGACTAALMVMLVLLHGTLGAGLCGTDVHPVGRAAVETPAAMPAADRPQLSSGGTEQDAQTPSHPQHWVVRTPVHSSSAPVVTDTAAVLTTALSCLNTPPRPTSADVREPFQRSALLRC